MADFLLALQRRGPKVAASLLRLQIEGEEARPPSSELDLASTRLLAQSECLWSDASDEIEALSDNLRRRLASDQAIRRLGDLLADAAIPHPIADVLREATHSGPVRVWIQCDPHLAHLPWEALHDPLELGFLSQHPAIRLMRLVFEETDGGRLPPLQSVLIAFANPATEAFPDLPQGEMEIEALERALESSECKRLHVDVLRGASERLLRRKFAGSGYGAFHFVGHGTWRPGGGTLALEGGRFGEADEVTVNELAPLLKEAGVHLVVLNGCDTGGSSASVANGLCEAGIAIVVAMQTEISDTGAYHFARAFYASLALGQSVSDAFWEARSALGRRADDWLAPLLVARSVDSVVSRPLEARTPGAIRSNLPSQVSGFIGRSRELDEVVRLLQRERLVTLHGSGGIGKTRLSIEVGLRQLDCFQEGVWQVLLDEMRDPDRIYEEIARPFGIVEATESSIEARLLAFLRDRELLVVLDNCEHVAEACQSAVRKILAMCPHVHVLATSRHVLNIPGEVVVRLPSLTVHPFEEDQPFELLPERALLEYEAVQLFDMRARAADSTFRLATDNLEAVCRIVYRLDGIPLAIELAAARTRSLSPEQILEMLADEFAVLNLGGPGFVERHETVRATVEWSYDLLTDEEQLAFMRLGVFAGSFDLEAAEAVLNALPLEPSRHFSLLSNLVDKSLVLSENLEGEKRFRLLETTRFYALRWLAARGEHREAFDRLLDYLCDFASRSYLAMSSGKQQLRWRARISAHYSNIIAAIDWGGGEGASPHKAATVARDFFNYWVLIGEWKRGRKTIDRILARMPEGHETLRIQLLALSGAAAVYTGDASGLARAQEAYRLAKRSPDLPQAYANAWLFGCCYVLGRDEETQKLGEEILERAAILVQKGREGLVRWQLGNMALGRGDREAARSQYSELLSVKATLGDVRGTGLAKCQLAYLAWAEGQAEYKDLFLAGLEDFLAVYDSFNLGLYAGLATRMCLPQDPHTAARLQGWSHRMQEEAGAVPDRFVVAWSGDVFREAREALGAAYEGLYREGMTLTPELVLLEFRKLV